MLLLMQQYSSRSFLSPHFREASSGPESLPAASTAQQDVQDVQHDVIVYFSVVNQVRRVETTPRSRLSMRGLFTSRVRAALLRLYARCCQYCYQESVLYSFM